VTDHPFVGISIQGIRAWGRHGADAGEQDVPQPLEIGLDLSAAVGRSRTSDELADTIDYAALHARVVTIVETRRYRLLERLGEAILEAVMHDERVAMASVTIAKPALLDGATPKVSVSKFQTSEATRAAVAAVDGGTKKKAKKKHKRRGAE
jgi:FolB domain-containing protein